MVIRNSEVQIANSLSPKKAIGIQIMTGDDGDENIAEMKRSLFLFVKKCKTILIISVRFSWMLVQEIL